MRPHTQAYIRLVEEALLAPVKSDRTGVGTRCLGVATLQHDLSYGFPLYTCRKLSLKVMATELCWMLRGSDNTSYLAQQNVNIWKPWENILHERRPLIDPPGYLGRVYGAQWRSFGQPSYGTDQLAEVVKSLWTNPSNRRMIVSAWSPNELSEMALPPCHHCWQVTVVGGEFLDMMVTQRSVDLPVGCPHDVGMYALLMHVLAKPLKLKPRKLLFAFGDAHIYLNQIELVEEMVCRYYIQEPELIWLRETVVDNTGKVGSFMPICWESHLEMLSTMTPGEFVVNNYEHHPSIKFPVAV